MWRVSGAGVEDVNGIYFRRSQQHFQKIGRGDLGRADNSTIGSIEWGQFYNRSCKGRLAVTLNSFGRFASHTLRSEAQGRDIYKRVLDEKRLQCWDTISEEFDQLPKVEYIAEYECRYEFPESQLENGSPIFYNLISFIEKFRDEYEDEELWSRWQAMGDFEECPEYFLDDRQRFLGWKSKVTSTDYSTVVAALRGISEHESSSVFKKHAEGIDPEAVMKREFARVKEAEAEGTLKGPSEETINPETCAEKGGMPWEDVLLLMLRQIENKDPNSVIYFFIPREELLATEGALPCFQILAKQGKLRGFKMDLAAAVSHKYRKRFAIISHRWTARGDPDHTGSQLTKIKEMAQANQSAEYFWIDFPCMPQSWKDDSGSILCEKCDINSQYFKQGLKNVNVLYLGGEVWILLDVDYLHRFWCILEAFLATHDTTKHGLIKSLDHVKIGYMGVAESYPDAFEFVLKCIVYEVEDTSAMLTSLKRDDAFTVTNQSDKDTQVEVLSHLEDKIKMLCRDP